MKRTQLHRMLAVALGLVVVAMMPLGAPMKGETQRGVEDQELLQVNRQPNIQSSLSTLTGCSSGNHAGIQLCEMNGVYVVKINLEDTSLVVKPVIAPNGGTAELRSLAGSDGLVAINGDYFSGCPDTVPPLNCGEGYTRVDGTDYTDYQQDDWKMRRALGFSRDYRPNIGFEIFGELNDYHWQALGGGPQITFGGEFRWRCWGQGNNTYGDCRCRDGKITINDEIFNCTSN